MANQICPTNPIYYHLATLTTNHAGNTVSKVLVYPNSSAHPPVRFVKIHVGQRSDFGILLIFS